MFEPPPPDFDDAFFSWLDRASDRLSVDFASKGDLVESEIVQIEDRLGFALPNDIRRFYLRYSVWGVLRNWTGWDRAETRVTQTTGIDLPLVPIDFRGYGSGGQDVLAAVESHSRYHVIACNRSTDNVRRYESLRSYFVAQVEDEVRLGFE